MVRCDQTRPNSDIELKKKKERERKFKMIHSFQPKQLVDIPFNCNGIQ